MANYDFSYLIDKIEKAEFVNKPFKHIYIEDFFSDDHFKEIVESQEIKVPEASNDDSLIDSLNERGYKVISFPGAITNRKTYVAWHNGRKKGSHHTACESAGFVMRLFQAPSQIIDEINKFIWSEEFNKSIAKKFGFNFNDCTIDAGIQKYLDGYEISPHPDVRKKAATFMVNINPSELSESSNHHTHYLKFRPEKDYVRSFWENNKSVERAWVPWDWTETVSQQTKNNSIVLFSPSDDTMHGVKADYNHLVTQRTQLYGNLWYKEQPPLTPLEWEDLDLLSASKKAKYDLKSIVKRILPKDAISRIKMLTGGKDVGNRDY